MNHQEEHQATAGYNYQTTTRWLHFGLIIGVILQLSSSLMMAHPDEHGTAFGKTLMQYHQWSGMIVAIIIFANVTWAVILRGNPPKRQIMVLFDKTRWHKAMCDLKTLPAVFHGTIGFISPSNTLSFIIEMLGLSIMAGMAITGTIIWFTNDAGGPHSHEHISLAMEVLLTSHSLLSKLLWLYITGHVFMAIMHARAGHRPFARILPFGVSNKRSEK